MIDSSGFMHTHRIVFLCVFLSTHSVTSALSMLFTWSYIHVYSIEVASVQGGGTSEQGGGGWVWAGLDTPTCVYTSHLYTSAERWREMKMVSLALGQVVGALAKHLHTYA